MISFAESNIIKRTIHERNIKEILITSIFRMAEECSSHLLLLFSMTVYFKEDNECTGHLVFLFLMTCIFRMAEKCNSHLVFLLLMIGCFQKDKECPSNLGLFLTTSTVTRDVFLIVYQILVFKNF